MYLHTRGHALNKELKRTMSLSHISMYFPSGIDLGAESAGDFFLTAEIFQHSISSKIQDIETIFLGLNV